MNKLVSNSKRLSPSEELCICKYALLGCQDDDYGRLTDFTSESLGSCIVGEGAAVKLEQLGWTADPS